VPWHYSKNFKNKDIDMATKNRFSTHQFCAAWMLHGPATSTWPEFAAKMRAASGDSNYQDSEIERRLALYATQLKGKHPAPKYPKPRTPSALAFFQNKKKAG